MAAIASKGIDLFGILSGGRAQVDAAALSAKTGQVARDVRADLLEKFTRLGEVVGAHTGADFLQAAAQGAQATGSRARNEAAKSYGVDPAKIQMTALAIGALILVGLFLWKAR